MAAGFVGFIVEKGHADAVEKNDEAEKSGNGKCATVGVQVIVNLADNDRQKGVAVMDDAVEIEFAVFQRTGKEFMIARQPPAHFARFYVRC